MPTFKLKLAAAAVDHCEAEPAPMNAAAASSQERLRASKVGVENQRISAGIPAVALGTSGHGSREASMQEKRPHKILHLAFA